MFGIRLHDLPVRTFLGSLALVCLSSLYSCAGKASTDAPNPQITGKPEAKGAGVKAAVGQTAKALPQYKFLKPEHVKGLYWTAFTAGSAKAREKQFKIIDATELNAVVIDVRDSGNLYFKTGIKQAMAIKGLEDIGVSKPAVLMASLEKHHVWPIARIACFKDNYIPKAHPELAVQFPNGKVWHDRSRNHNSWLDPYNKKNWEYIAQIVDYAMDIGFPEIQLDYVRFPTEGKMSSQVYPAKKTYAAKDNTSADVIAAFTKFIVDRVHARHGVIGADIFGIISSTKGDEGIGQQLEKVVGSFDVLCPMIYPSHFANGEYGIKSPNNSPYEIIKKSLDDYKRRLPKTSIRPWLQAFSLGVRYGAPELRAQIKATREVGYQGFLLWNPENKYPYVEAAIGKKEPSGAK